MDAERRIEPWPLAVGGLLAMMIGACLLFWNIAATNPDPEVVDDAYLAGLRLNQELRARQRAADLGYELSLGTRAEDGGVRVEVAVRDAGGGRPAVDSVVVRRERPAEGGFDADFALEPEGEAFAGWVPLPRPGRWRLIATAAVGEERVQRVFALGGAR